MQILRDLIIFFITLVLTFYLSGYILNPIMRYFTPPCNPLGFCVPSTPVVIGYWIGFFILLFAIFFLIKLLMRKLFKTT